MKVECCDNCKRPFEEFKTDTGESAWGFIPDNNGDIEYLMSNLEKSFFVFTEQYPERAEGLQYWCANCVEAINNNEGD